MASSMAMEGKQLKLESVICGLPAEKLNEPGGTIGDSSRKIYWQKSVDSSQSNKCKEDPRSY